MLLRTFNPVFLHRFLVIAEGDADVAFAEAKACMLSRVEHQADAVRMEKDMSLATLPYANAISLTMGLSSGILGTDLDGRTVTYNSLELLGSFDSESFIMTQYDKYRMYRWELFSMIDDARCAAAGRQMGSATIYNFAGSSLQSIMEVMRTSPDVLLGTLNALLPAWDQMVYFVNFPREWKCMFDSVGRVAGGRVAGGRGGEGEKRERETIEGGRGGSRIETEK